MNKIKNIIVSLSIMFIATALLIFATYNENLNKATRSFIGLVWLIILIVTIIWNYIKVKKQMDNK